MQPVSDTARATRTTPRLVAGWVIVAVLWALPAAASDDLRLVEAVKVRDLAAVRTLLAESVDVNTPQPDGATALHWAVHWTDLETVALLLGAGAKVNVANDFGVTALSLACTNGSAAMVDLLLGAGADPNAVGMTGETPLMTAARTGILEVVEALLAHGADVYAAESTQAQTALMWAVSETHPMVVRTLIAHGADVHARSTGGFTPLLFAAREGDLDSARALVEAGANVNDATAESPSALVVATVRGHAPVAIWLLDQGADANAAGAGFAALHWAAGSWETEITGPYGFVAERHDEWRALRGVPTQRLELVKALLDHGADPNARLVKPPPRVGFSVFNTRSLEGATPFWLAAMAADVDSLRLLAASGADPHVATTNEPPKASFDGQSLVHRGTTSLMVAAGVGRNMAESLVTNDRALGAVKFIWELGGDVNAVNQVGNTALHGAAHTRSDALVQFLVDNAAEVNVRNEGGETPLTVAERYVQPGTATIVARTSTGDLLRELGAR